MKINEIYNENCLDTMARMSPKFIDLVVTSPPYGDMRDYHGFTFNFKIFKEIAAALFRVIKPGGVMVWVVTDETKDGNESGVSFMQALHFKSIGFNLFDTMIFEKPSKGARGSCMGYWQDYEFMFVLSKGRPKTANLIHDRRNLRTKAPKPMAKRLKDGAIIKENHQGYGAIGRRNNIWRYNVGWGLTTKDSEAFKHPATFPERLARDHIVSWSVEADLVYDPFSGSGTTPKMAYLLRRNYLGSEISEEYCNVARRRIRDASMQEELL